MKNSCSPNRIIQGILRLTVCSGVLLSCIPFLGFSYGSDPTESRRARINVPPEYPELARRLSIKGVARVQIKISAGGDVTDVKEVGGNPVLLDALKRAVKKWKYEPSERENTLEIKYDFVP